MYILVERVILFLTDGEKTAGGDPLTLIANRNGNLSNEVVILTYGLGACKYLTVFLKKSKKAKSIM